MKILNLPIILSQKILITINNQIKDVSDLVVRSGNYFFDELVEQSEILLVEI